MSEFAARSLRKITLTDLISIFSLIFYIPSVIFARYTNVFFSFTNPLSDFSSFINFVIPFSFLVGGLIAIKSIRFNYIAPILLLFPLVDCLVDIPIVIYINGNNFYINFGYISEFIFIILISFLIWNLLRTKPLKIEVSIQSIIFALITTFIVLFYWIGRWLPWTYRNSLIRAEGFSWNKNGEKLLVERLNNLSDTLTNAWGIAEFLGVLFTLIFIILIAILKDQRMSSVLILILGSKSLLLPLSSLLVPIGGSINAKFLGYTQEKIDELQLVVTQSRGIGIWVCFFASILLLLTALFSAFFSQVKAPVRKKN